LSREQFFMVIVKALGVWIVIDGLIQLPTTFTRLSQYSPKLFSVGLLFETLAEPLVPLGIGVWLFLGASWFARLAFSERTSPDDLADDSAHK
jgi:hypothetical protein